MSTLAMRAPWLGHAATAATASTAAMSSTVVYDNARRDGSMPSLTLCPYG